MFHEHELGSCSGRPVSLHQKVRICDWCHAGGRDMACIITTVLSADALSTFAAVCLSVLPHTALSTQYFSVTCARVDRTQLGLQEAAYCCMLVHTTAQHASHAPASCSASGSVTWAHMAWTGCMCCILAACIKLVLKLTLNPPTRAAITFAALIGSQIPFRW